MGSVIRCHTSAMKRVSVIVLSTCVFVSNKKSVQGGKISSLKLLC